MNPPLRQMLSDVLFMLSACIGGILMLFLIPIIFLLDWSKKLLWPRAVVDKTRKEMYTDRRL